MLMNAYYSVPVEDGVGGKGEVDARKRLKTKTNKVNGVCGNKRIAL